MGVKLSLSHSGKSIGRRRSRMGCWGVRGWGDLGPKREEVTGTGGNSIMKSFTMCTAHQMLFG